MTSIEERLQIKREPIDKWSIREKLCLAVARSTDQNLTSISRVLKPFSEPNRPNDWFNQKNCAAQYGALLANCETPKRKKRAAGAEPVLETPTEAILRKLLHERKLELRQLLAAERAEYGRLRADVALLSAGKVAEAQLDAWCAELDAEEREKAQEALAHDRWLREREQRKLEIERQWRPIKPLVAPAKRKSESMEPVPMELEASEEPIKDAPRPALSPLLTSLLKSPSQAPQRACASNPTIASLLTTPSSVPVSPSLQQLVSTALTPEPDPELDNTAPGDILDDPNLQVLKIDDLASSLIENGPLPEMKNDVDVIISDLIENTNDLVADPEQHLQLDGNGDLNLNLELEELEAETEAESAGLEICAPSLEKAESPIEIDDQLEDDNTYDKQVPSVDPFEFQDEPEETPPLTAAKPVVKTPVLEVRTPTPPVIEDAKQDTIIELLVEAPIIEEVKQEPEPAPEPKIEEEEAKPEVELKPDLEEVKEEVNEQSVFDDLLKSDAKAESPVVEDEAKVEIEPKIGKESPLPSDFGEELYDDITMEVKIDKTGKAKRDYSRTKKKEEKEFDMLLTLEKVGDGELTEENLSDYGEVDKKDTKLKVKSENDRSSSPWTEEDELTASRTKRRVSTPATPVDSVPTSPVSSIFAYDDDRDYKSWKKSVLLVYNRLSTHKYASLFTKPITNEQAPGYHTCVRRPMDLQTIRKGIESGAVRTTAHFERDVLLMMHNAIMYNKTNETVYDMAREMQREVYEQVQILKEAQSQEDAPARRETRTSEPGLKRKRLDESVGGVGRSKKRKED